MKCTVCNAPAQGVCDACLITPYCSHVCQEKDLHNPIASHAKLCGRIMWIENGTKRGRDDDGHDDHVCQDGVDVITQEPVPAEHFDMDIGGVTYCFAFENLLRWLLDKVRDPNYNPDFEQFKLNADSVRRMVERYDPDSMLWPRRIIGSGDFTPDILLRFADMLDAYVERKRYRNADIVINAIELNDAATLRHYFEQGGTYDDLPIYDNKDLFTWIARFARFAKRNMYLDVINELIRHKTDDNDETTPDFIAITLSVTRPKIWLLDMVVTDDNPVDWSIIQPFVQVRNMSGVKALRSILNSNLQIRDSDLRRIFSYPFTQLIPGVLPPYLHAYIDLVMSNTLIYKSGRLVITPDVWLLILEKIIETQQYDIGARLFNSDISDTEVIGIFLRDIPIPMQMALHLSPDKYSFGVFYSQIKRALDEQANPIPIIKELENAGFDITATRDNVSFIYEFMSDHFGYNALRDAAIRYMFTRPDVPISQRVHKLDAIINPTQFSLETYRVLMEHVKFDINAIIERGWEGQTFFISEFLKSPIQETTRDPAPIRDYFRIILDRPDLDLSVITDDDIRKCARQANQIGYMYKFDLFLMLLNDSRFTVPTNIAPNNYSVLALFLSRFVHLVLNSLRKDPEYNHAAAVMLQILRHPKVTVVESVHTGAYRLPRTPLVIVAKLDENDAVYREVFDRYISKLGPMGTLKHMMEFYRLQ